MLNTDPGREVVLGLEVDLWRLLTGEVVRGVVVREVSLEGVAGQLKVDLFLLTTLRPQHALPQVCKVQLPRLALAVKEMAPENTQAR